MWRVLTAVAFFMYVNKGSKAAGFWMGCVWFWPHTWWGSLAAGQHQGHGQAQDSLGRQLQKWVRCRSRVPCSPSFLRWACGSSAITTPLVKREGFSQDQMILKAEVPRQKAHVVAWAQFPQRRSLRAGRSPHPSQIPVLPSNYTASSFRRRGSEWCFLIFFIHSEHHVLVKNNIISVFKILPLTWHFCLSIKCFAVIARLQACHLFLIKDLNDSMEIKYMQV